MKATKRLVLYLPPIFLLSPLKETAAQTKQYGGRHMGFGMIFWVAFWVLVIVGLVFAERSVIG